MNKRAEMGIYIFFFHVSRQKGGKYPIISTIASSNLKVLVITMKVQQLNVPRLFRRDIQQKG